VRFQDIETYRGTFKKQIKDWLANISQRKNQDWLIVHIVRPDARAVAGSFFQMKGSVLDKIKGDFNTDKRDRLV
jgi:trafficking protein particle complex subunit 10